MRIAISADGKDLNSNLDQRFGRCEYFLIVDIENGKILKSEAVLNEGAEQGHGAGIKAAEQIGELEADSVLTGQLGPNATTVLGKLKIKAYHASGKVNDAISMFLENKLEQISESAEPHQSNVSMNSPKHERFFIPLLDNKGMDSEISGHFGHAPFFAIYDTKTKKIEIKENDLNHTDPNKSPVDQIVELANPTTVFALGIGARAIQLFNEKGITIKTGDCSTVKEVVENIKNLKSQAKDCGHNH